MLPRFPEVFPRLKVVRHVRKDLRGAVLPVAIAVAGALVWAHGAVGHDAGPKRGPVPPAPLPGYRAVPPP